MRTNPLPLSDEHSRPGIVFAFRFDGNGTATPLPLTAMPEIGDSGAAFWWVHVNLVDKRGRDWINSLPQLPDEAKEILVATTTHDRIDVEGRCLVGALVDLRLDFGQATEEPAQLRFALADRLLVTARRQSLRSIEATRVAIAGGHAVDSALDLLEDIIDREADSLAQAATELGHAVDSIEDRLLAGHAEDARESVGAVRRRSVKINRQLSRLLVLLRRVEHAPALRLPADLREAAGRMAQRFEMIHQEVHAAQERARLLQEEAAGRMAAEGNRQLYILSMLTAVFLPATLVTGLFGMNTKGLPFEDHEAAFWLAVVVAITASMLVFVGLMVSLRRSSRQR